MSTASVPSAAGPMPPQTVAATAPRWRTITTQIIAGLVGLLIGIAFFSLPLLVLAWFGEGADVMHAIHGLGWGIVGGLVVAVGLLSQTWRPAGHIAGLQMTLLGIIALAAAAGLGLSSPAQISPFVIVGLILAWLHPAREELFRAGTAGRPNIPQAVVALIGLVPLGIYALTQGALSRGATPSDPHLTTDGNHYESMVAMAVAIGLVGLLGAARTRGWRLPTIVAGAGVTYFGVASIASDAAGSVGDLWGAVAVVAGLVYLVLGLRDQTGEQRAAKNAHTGSLTVSPSEGSADR